MKKAEDESLRGLRDESAADYTKVEVPKGKAKGWRIVWSGVWAFTITLVILVIWDPGVDQVDQVLAKMGNAWAQCELGWCYEEGKGVEKSYEEAVKWYRKAAEQGHAGAQFLLGGCCYKGEGVEQSYEEAVEWFRKAAEQGDEDAKEALEELEKKMANDKK